MFFAIVRDRVPQEAQLCQRTGAPDANVNKCELGARVRVWRQSCETMSEVNTRRNGCEE